MAFPYYNGLTGYPPAYPQQMTAPQQQSLLIRVSGEAEAYNYPMTAGITLMFTDGASIYVKTTDSSPVGGFRFEVFDKRTNRIEAPEYLTKAEFEAYKASLVKKEASHVE